MTSDSAPGMLAAFERYRRGPRSAPMFRRLEVRMRTMILALTLFLPGLAEARPYLEWDAPDHAAAPKRDDVEQGTAKGVLLAARVVPLAPLAALAIAGVTIVDSSPIALSASDEVGARAMRHAGVSMMGGALVGGIVMNGVARAGRVLVGGKWDERLAPFVVGIALSLPGYGLVIVGSDPTLVTRGVGAPLLVGGTVLWNIGTLLLAIDALKIGWDEYPKARASSSARGPRLAGLWVVPTRGGVSAGFALQGP
jgi:hypothetical protein